MANWMPERSEMECAGLTVRTRVPSEEKKPRDETKAGCGLPCRSAMTAHLPGSRGKAGLSQAAHKEEQPMPRVQPAVLSHWKHMAGAATPGGKRPESEMTESWKRGAEGTRRTMSEFHSDLREEQESQRGEEGENERYGRKEGGGGGGRRRRRRREGAGRKGLHARRCLSHSLHYP
eukprot:763714-Hanusia_phi.AAC.1